MYIIEIILEGFKSYAQRTVIKDFDRQFNAVTGFNGSGKSNIMDSIMFVLGLSKDWDILRVQSMKELIYKSGHAGITKAEATIIFDNTDKASSPMGYEKEDRITVTRQVTLEKSKYFVNGVNLQQNKVKNMFRSCQLNIDNPHFYVAQGRITKIINLKSSELISMLEETAGTALYNKKKKESTRIIQKKDEKVKEINDMIENEILPQITKLRSQREQYLLWKSQETELLRLTKLIKSFEYSSQNKTMISRITNCENLKQEKERQIQEKQSIQEELQKIMEKLQEFKSKFNQEQRNQSKQIDAELSDKKKIVAKKMTEVENRKARIQESERDLQDMERSLNENKHGIQRAKDRLAFFRESLQNLEGNYQQKKEQLEDTVSNMDQVKKGNVSSEEARTTVQRNINNVKAHFQQTQFSNRNFDEQIRHLQREIEQQQHNLVNAEQESKDNDQQQAILEREIEALESDINQSNFDELRMQQLRHSTGTIDNDIMSITHEIQRFLQGPNWIFRLSFRDPEPGFDRRKVKGRIFSLFSAREERFLKALEFGSGGRLLNIVIDNEITGKELLRRNCFDYGVNFIPNNKINCYTPSEQILNHANQIAHQHGGFAIPAYEAINFDNSVRNSMLFVFGGFLICSSADIAKKIANNNVRNLRFKCVTLEGDIFDTQGLLSGGYQNTNSMVLSRYEEFKQMQNQQSNLRNDQRRLQDEYDQMKRDEQYINGLRQDLDQKKRKLEYALRQSNVMNSNKIQEKIENNQLSIKDLLEQQQRTEILAKQYQKEIEELEKELNQLSSSSSSNYREIYERKIKKLKEDTHQLEKEIRKMKQDISNKEVEQGTCTKNVEKLGRKKEEESKKLVIEKDQISRDKATLKSNQNEVKELISKKEEIEKEIHQYNKQSKKLQQQETELKENNKKIEEDLEKIEHRINKYTKDIKNISESLQELEKNFSWIKTSKESFGEPGTEFDYQDFHYDQQCQKYAEMKLEQDKLSKKVNFTVEATSDNVEKKFADLKEKRETLQQDKQSLETNMEELDRKRQQTLEQCYLRVNENFGKIFSDLLPNAFAKLSPLEGKTIDEGLELNVKLGKAWRNSLSELSGGQRSLLALSFVLSLLLYKPAPFYILDEVDAALDTSHTENIGHMVAQRFPQSQFLIISHKEGMYQNANVLFKTSIVDGNSRIDRFQFQSKQNKKK